jgi:hypothetical protein
MEGFFEHDNEPSGSIKYWEVLEYMYKWQPLKMDSASYSETFYINIPRYYISSFAKDLQRKPN